MTAGINEQVIGAHTLFGQTVDFTQDIARVNDHARPDDVHAVGVEDTRRDELQFIFFAIDDNGVTGVVAALTAHNQIGMCCEDVDKFTLAFIAPLGTENYFARHICKPLSI